MLNSGRRERLRKGEKYKELGAMTLLLFISFWKCHSWKRKFPPCSLQLWMEVDSLFWILDERLLFHDLLLKKKNSFLFLRPWNPHVIGNIILVFYRLCSRFGYTHTHTRTDTHYPIHTQQNHTLKMTDLKAFLIWSRMVKTVYNND